MFGRKGGLFKLSRSFFFVKKVKLIADKNRRNIIKRL